MKKETRNQIVATITNKTGLTKAEAIEILGWENSYEPLTLEEAYEIYKSLPSDHNNKFHFYCKFVETFDVEVKKTTSLKELVKFKKYQNPNDDVYNSHWDKLAPVAIKDFEELIFILCNSPQKSSSHRLAEERFIDFIDKIEKVKSLITTEKIYYSCSDNSQPQKIMADKLYRTYQAEYKRRDNLKKLVFLYLRIPREKSYDIKTKALFDRLEELGRQKVEEVKTESQAARLCAHLIDKVWILLLDKWLGLINDHSGWLRFQKSFCEIDLFQEPEFKDIRLRIDDKNNILLGQELDRIKQGSNPLGGLRKLTVYLNNKDACQMVSNFSRRHVKNLAGAIKTYNFFNKQEELRPYAELFEKKLLAFNRSVTDVQIIFKLANNPDLKLKVIEDWLEAARQSDDKTQVIGEAGEIFQTIRNNKNKSGIIGNKIWNIKREIIKLMQQKLEPLEPKKLAKKYRATLNHVSEN